MRRKRIIALTSVAALCIGLLSGCGCAANTDKTNPSATQSESAVEQDAGDGQSSGKDDDGTSTKQDAANDEAQETEVVDEVEIELDSGEASGGM